MPVKNIKKSKNQKKFFVYAFLVILVIIAISISIIIYTQSKRATNNFLISRVETVAAAFDEKDFRGLRFDSSDENSEIYLRLKNKMIQMADVNEDVRFFYVMTMVGDDVVFVVDSEPEGSEDESPPGQVYTEATENVYDSFKSFEAILTGAETDRWGTWVTAFSPIKTGDEIKFVVGVDMDADQYASLPFFYALIPTLLLLVVLFLGFVIVYMRKKEFALMNAKTNFVSIASHELRSPLSGIRWSIELLLKDGTISDKSKAVIKNMGTSTLRLISIINELLDLSAYESKKVDQSQFTKISVNNLLQESVDNFSITIQARDIKIDYIKSGKELFVMGDHAKLLNAFNNIISNAIKYSNDKNQVTVSVQETDPNVSIMITDHGIGIPTEDIEKVTSGFYRSHNAQIHTMEGTGVGLYVSEYAIQEHNGTFDIESALGVGTIVTIKLPLAL